MSHFTIWNQISCMTSKHCSVHTIYLLGVLRGQPISLFKYGINQGKEVNQHRLLTFLKIYVFRHYCPCQFKIKNTTDINYNKASLLKQLSGLGFFVVDIFRFNRLYSQSTNKKLSEQRNLSKQHNEVGVSLGVLRLS